MNWYCVSVSVVAALKSPPSAVAIVPSWLVQRFGVPRNIMCSCACAMPGNIRRIVARTDEVGEVRRDDGRERVAHDDDA